MRARQASPALLQFVDDEMLRAPMLFDQLVEGAIDHGRKALPTLPALQHSAMADLLHALRSQQTRLGEYFVRSLRDQADAELASPGPPRAVKTPTPLTLALVDEEEVALDVELSHTIEAIKSAAEYELRELQTFLSALVGDMQVSGDHNPFRPETYARALWAAAQALPLSRGHQVAFMRAAGTSLAQLLRTSYAASTSRLESRGVEPAAYRTLILPPGSRRGGRSSETTYTPDLQRMRETMPAPLDQPLRFEDQPQAKRAASTTRSGTGMPWTETRQSPNRVDRQALELVSRLFEAMLQDDRLPQDVALMISRLQGPAMRLALRDNGLLDQDKHPLWRLINRLVYEAEMVPDPGDPERILLLRLAQGIVDQLASEPDQNTGLHTWALTSLETFLHKRMTRRLASAASQIGALQKLEDKLFAGHAAPTSMHGMLDVPQLDTVPAEMLAAQAPALPASADAGEWLDALRPGDWVRMFLQGRWIQARLLWPGERREAWLFGDGASDQTWAVRRGALLMMHREHLAKPLRQRSIVASAARRLHKQLAEGVATS